MWPDVYPKMAQIINSSPLPLSCCSEGSHFLSCSAPTWGTVISKSQSALLPTKYENDSFLTANGVFDCTFNFLPISSENWHLYVNFNLDSSYYKWEWIYFQILKEIFYSFLWKLSKSFAYCFQFGLSFYPLFLKLLYIGEIISLLSVTDKANTFFQLYVLTLWVFFSVGFFCFVLFVCVCVFGHTKVLLYILTESNLSAFPLLQLDFES